MTLFLFVVAAVLAGVTGTSPAPPGSSFPDVVSDGRGGIYMSWLETLPEDGGHRLRIARRDANGAWTQATTIEEGKSFWPNWADFPGLGVFRAGELMAFWLARSGPGTYSYDIWAKTSKDGGKTWSAAFRINEDGKQAEHGFVSVAALSNGHLGVSWLDGRNTASHGGDHETAPGAMSLRYAEFSPDGKRTFEIELDAKVCDCCQTAVTTTSKGPLVAYRDRSDTEVRDISFVRPSAREAKSTAAPREFSRDGWAINACPVNGPALSASADGNTVVAAWFTQANKLPRTKIAISFDGGETFGDSLVLAEGVPLGRVDVALTSIAASAKPDAIATWLDKGDVAGRAFIRARRLRGNGGLGPAFTIAETSAARASGFPRFAVTGDALTIAWTEPPNVETKAPAQVIVKTIPLSDVP